MSTAGAPSPFLKNGEPEVRIDNGLGSVQHFFDDRFVPQGAIRLFTHDALLLQSVDKLVEESGIEKFRRIQSVETRHFCGDLTAANLQRFPGLTRLPIHVDQADDDLETFQRRHDDSRQQSQLIVPRALCRSRPSGK